jgi:phosphoglycerate dehydrogenase-like enzyme
MILVLPALARPLLEPHLPPDAEPRWFASAEDAYAMAPGAEVGWLDMQVAKNTGRAIALGEDLKLVCTIYAGTDAFPLKEMKARGTRLCNGVGINATAVAEYAVMGMLNLAKDFPTIMRAQDRREWLLDAPGKVELEDSKALIIGYGAIGRRIGRMLEGFGVAVTGVRRSTTGESNMLGPDEWKPRLGEFDWIIVAAPATSETAHLFGAAEFATMKPSAYLVNIARGSLIDQDALIAALDARQIAGAFLDVTDPEPLPPEHPLWAAPNTIITMHLSGRAQTRMFQRAATLFLDNLTRYRAGEPLVNEVDLDLGY